MSENIIIEDFPEECPNCGLGRWVISTDIEGTRIFCPVCNYSTPKFEKQEQTVRYWNDGEEQSNP